VHVTGNNGKTWAAATGVPAGSIVESDRVNANKFYAFNAGTFYVSTNGGTSFTVASTGLPISGQFKAVPGREGHIWFAAGSLGLWRSINSGATFNQVTGVEEADNIGFGKAAPTQTYPALYTSAKIAGVRGIYRSDNESGTWVRINDDQHQYGWTGKAITGDPRIYGRVYVATNGRGIIYGDISTANQVVAARSSEDDVFTISSNPSNGKDLTLNFSVAKAPVMTIRIMKLSGEVVTDLSIGREQFSGDRLSLVLKNRLPGGLYLVRVSSGDREHTTRLIVE
jgi:hypothetical protein